jgi:A/G-specific adenine glycosylase
MNISNILINWYNQHKRDLPWRATSNPYVIWVSEIILQQTRVDQGMDYYNRFLTRFPDVFSLAEANEQEVLKLWQGLGYYSRARNMHSTAIKIVKEFGGVFPANYSGLLKLRGIGPYTASAIASICFGECTPVVDGNVMRVISRYYGIDKPVNTPEGQKAIYEACNLIIDRKQPGEFNQALMEFGALQCTPGKPQCILCPLISGCEAYRKGMVEYLPVKTKSAKPKHRYFNYLVVIQEKSGNEKVLYLRKRTGNDIWKGLYELPLIEMAEASEPEELYSSRGWNEIFNQEPLEILEYSDNYKHQLSHQTIHARFVLIRVKELPEGIDSWEPVSLSQLISVPIPRLIDRYLKNQKIL